MSATDEPELITLATTEHLLNRFGVLSARLALGKYLDSLSPEDDRRLQSRIEAIGSEILHRAGSTPEEPERPFPQPGDLCELLGDGMVRHRKPCTDYPDGTVTNIKGEVVDL